MLFSLDSLNSKINNMATERKKYLLRYMILVKKCFRIRKPESRVKLELVMWVICFVIPISFQFILVQLIKWEIFLLFPFSVMHMAQQINEVTTMHIFPVCCEPHSNSHDSINSQIMSLNIYRQIHLLPAEFLVSPLSYCTIFSAASEVLP